MRKLMDKSKAVRKFNVVGSNLYVMAPIFRREAPEIFWGSCLPLYMMDCHRSLQRWLTCRFLHNITNVSISYMIMKLSVTMLADNNYCKRKEARLPL